MNWKEIAGLLTGIGLVTTVAYAMVWGVPNYIDIKVEERLRVLTAEASIPTEVTDLQNVDESIKGSIEGIRGELKGINGQLSTLAADVSATRSEVKETKNLMIDFLRGE